LLEIFIKSPLLDTTLVQSPCIPTLMASNGIPNDCIANHIPWFPTAALEPPPSSASYNVPPALVYHNGV